MLLLLFFLGAGGFSCPRQLDAHEFLRPRTRCYWWKDHKAVDMQSEEASQDFDEIRKEQGNANDDGKIKRIAGKSKVEK